MTYIVKRTCPKCLRDFRLPNDAAAVCPTCAPVKKKGKK